VFSDCRGLPVTVKEGEALLGQWRVTTVRVEQQFSTSFDALPALSLYEGTRRASELVLSFDSRLQDVSKTWVDSGGLRKAPVDVRRTRSDWRKSS
jgi:hypothetical protein